MSLTSPPTLSVSFSERIFFCLVLLISPVIVCSSNCFRCMFSQCVYIQCSHCARFCTHSKMDGIVTFTGMVYKRRQKREKCARKEKKITRSHYVLTYRRHWVRWIGEVLSHPAYNSFDIFATFFFCASLFLICSIQCEEWPTVYAEVQFIQFSGSDPFHL